MKYLILLIPFIFLTSCGAKIAKQRFNQDALLENKKTIEDVFGELNFGPSPQDPYNEYYYYCPDEEIKEEGKSVNTSWWPW